MKKYPVAIAIKSKGHIVAIAINNCNKNCHPWFNA
jgi:hypothetical protein